MNTEIKSAKEILWDAFKQKVTQYIYDFAWNYGRFYHLADAETIISAVKERMQLPEEFIQAQQAINSSEDDAINFAEWLIENNMSPNGFGGWGGGNINVNLHGSTSKELYSLYLYKLKGEESIKSVEIK